MPTETLDMLPGQGETKTTASKRARRECEVCGEPAHFKHSFLFKNFRSNPKSKAYGRDDCSWASDIDVFVCQDCKPETPDGCDSGASVFPAIARFAHMFLYWKEEE